MKDLIKQYQETITNLIQRKEHLQAQLPTLRGQEHINTLKRISFLYEEQREAEWALGEMIKTLNS